MSGMLLLLVVVVAGIAGIPRSGTPAVGHQQEVAAARQQPAVAPNPAILPPGPGRRFERITFGTQASTPPGSLHTAERGDARVVCGLTLHEGDPALDPKFVRHVLRGDYKIRRVEPPVCGG
jgi:hypothetical protein